MSTPAYTNDRATYEALLYGLHRSCRSGVLEVKSGRSWRRITLVGGQPVSYESESADDQLEKTLVRSGLVPAKQMQWLRKKLSDGEEIADALILSGVIDLDDLDAHRAQVIERGVGSPLAWERGSWTFEGHEDLPADRVDPALLPAVVAMRGLWNGVRLHVHMNDAIGIVTDTSAGAVLPGEKLIPLLHQMELQDPLDQIGEVLGKGADIEELFRQIPDRSGHLVQLVWFLETAGAVQRAERNQTPMLQALASGRGFEELVPQAKGRAERAAAKPRGGRAAAQGAAAAVQPAAGRKVAASQRGSKAAKAEAGGPPPGKLAELVRTAHKHRMGGDFYGFLGVEATAKDSEVNEAYERLTGLWSRAAGTPGLEADAKKMVSELLAAAKLVCGTLGHRAKRAEYDKNREAGKAPSLAGRVEGSGAGGRSRGGATQAQKDLLKAHALVQRGEFSRALPQLQKLRLDDPSNASLLADLGWCMWRLREGSDLDDDGPEEYLLLAHTFDGKSAQTLEYLCRVAQEKGNGEEIARWATRLKAVAPSNSFAEAALAAVEDGGDGGGRRGRLWGKGR